MPGLNSPKVKPINANSVSLLPKTQYNFTKQSDKSKTIFQAAALSRESFAFTAKFGDGSEPVQTEPDSHPRKYDATVKKH